MTERSRRLHVSVLNGAAALFAVLFAAAASAYPGGTHFDHSSVGHDFWRNTLCDVARTVALDGRPNMVACTLARVAMTTLAFGLGALFMVLPELFAAERRAARTIRVLGAATVPAAVAVVLLPTDRFGTLHGLAIVVAGTLGLGATILVMKGVWADARTPRLIVVLGTLALGFGAADFGLYVRELALGGPAQVAVAVLERLATILVLLWMVAAAHALRASSRGNAAPGEPGPRSPARMPIP